MNMEAVEGLLRAAHNPGASDAFLKSKDAFFWVDWREEDDAIVEYCESLLETGELSAEIIDADNEHGFDMYIVYSNKRAKVSLTLSEDDRHITLCALNDILRPDYEVRFVIASKGSDTLAFVPLPSAEWQALERRYGKQVEKHFYRIAGKPNLYTDPLPF